MLASVHSLVESSSSGSRRLAICPYDTTALHKFIREAFPGTLLLEEHKVFAFLSLPCDSLDLSLSLSHSYQGTVTYQLPSAGVTWSTVFRQLEGNRRRLGIVDYSVSQTTLDQVS